MSKKKKKLNGFTLIELLVVAAVIVLLTAVILLSYRTGESGYALQRASHKLAQDLRRAQELAVSSHEFNGEPVSGGYGIRFLDIQPNSYILFADLDGSQHYNDEEEKVEEIVLEKGVSITGLSASPLNIVFAPPDPVTLITGGADSANITLNSKKQVFVNKVGLIEIK